MTQAWNYKAFISYSVEDDKVARKLSRAVERYRVPNRLIGTLGRDGVIPKQVGSVYCDIGAESDSELSAMERVDALKSSQYLIVVCSPAAAKSPRVNEEIRVFKSLRGENHVLCLIVAGEPNATTKPDTIEDECFPESVRYCVGRDGQLTNETTEPIAADARGGKDGFGNSRLKILSGLLGVAYDSLRRRDLRRRRMRLMQMASVGCVALAIGLYGYLAARNKNLELLRQKSAAIVAQSLKETASGNATNGLLLALEALPEDGRLQPWSTSAEKALYQAVVEHREILHLGPGIIGNIDKAALSPDGKLIAVAVGKTAVIWDSSTGEKIAQLEGHENQINAIVFSPDSSQLLTASDDMTARLWDISAGKEQLVLAGHVHNVQSGTFSADGSLIATASEDTTARIWETSNGALKHELLGHEGKVTSVSFSSDGHFLTTTSWDNTTKYWDVQTGEMLGGTGYEHGYLSDVFNAGMNVTNDYLLAVVGGPGALLLDADGTVAELGGVKGAGGVDGSVWRAVFSPNGQLIATSFNGFNEVWIWETATKTVRMKLRGHEGFITDLSFSPDSRKLVTTSKDRSTRLWDVASGREELRLGHNESAWQAIWCQDGERLLTRSGDFDITLWDVRIDRSKLELDQLMAGGMSHLRGAAEKLATRRLTLKQRMHFNLKHLNFIWPVIGQVIDGYRPDVDLNDFGIGIESIVGTPVVAVADGEVAETGENGWIVIQHGLGLFSSYRTDTPVALDKKQKVKKGEKIALVGKLDDRVTGIYFCLLENKIALDPLEYLPVRSSDIK